MLVPDDYLSVLFGSLVVVAALASSSNPKIDLSNRTRVTGGIVSEVMGTAAGIGGPPLALIYQNREGQEIRATLAVAFAMDSDLTSGPYSRREGRPGPSSPRARAIARAPPRAVGRRILCQSSCSPPSSGLRRCSSVSLDSRRAGHAKGPRRRYGSRRTIPMISYGSGS